MFPFSSKRAKILGVAVFFLLACPHLIKAKMLESSGLSQWSALLPHPLEENKFLAAAQNSIYVTSSEVKDQWQKWYDLPSKGLQIRKLFYFPQTPENVFMLTDQGIYKTFLTASGYETVYEKRKLNEQITDFAVAPEDSTRWFLATGSGVLESKDAGKSWHLFTPAEKKPVCFLRFSGKHFFVARPDALLHSENLSRFEKVFSLPSSEEPEDASEQLVSGETREDETFLPSACSLRDLTGSEKQGRFWLATLRGVFESRNAGLSWTSASSSGMFAQDIYFLTQDLKTNRVFAAGLYRIYGLSSANSRWREIPAHTDGSPIRGISLNGENLKIVTSSGLMTHVILPDNLFLTEKNLPGLPEKTLFQDLLRLEPTAVQIQRVVSRYHHTQNSKINRWQAESRLRALLPAVSFKKDFSFGNNVDIDRGSTNDPDKFIQGPADTSRGWDFGVSWDLGDFIFSTSQTSIDSREKLMMELRHDLLSEATRLFYERRRLQMEIILSPAPSEEEHLTRLLQIDELTALLDSLTNGFMSKQIELIYREHPELEALWKYSKSPGHQVTESQEKQKNV